MGLHAELMCKWSWNQILVIDFRIAWNCKYVGGGGYYSSSISSNSSSKLSAQLPNNSYLTKNISCGILRYVYNLGPYKISYT